ncbi:DUF3732 domain-containing protein [Streptomyces sp. NPDC057757]|uniref:DUF3732 domain-containing protein n=1 Tax=Streptomyces sp. NPDC057757 TaxID=3346241 RepID=UPI003690EF3E
MRRPTGRLPLNRIGSAKNWIGYHLVAHLALHTYLRRHDRPVPAFLMLDQPTQAFFPEKIHDAATVEDADWATVTRYFELLRDVAQLNDGALQIVVCDHANLGEAWFQDASSTTGAPATDNATPSSPWTGWIPHSLHLPGHRSRRTATHRPRAATGGTWATAAKPGMPFGAVPTLTLSGILESRGAAAWSTGMLG